MNARWGSVGLGWHGWKFKCALESEVMTRHARQTAVSPLLLLPQELIVSFEVKVYNSVSKLPSGVFSLGLHWCCNIAALLSVLYSEALG